MELAHRVVRRFLASRPIHVDKRAAHVFVDKTLVPALIEKFEALPQDEPLGSRRLLANRGFALDSVDRKEKIHLFVEVDSAPSPRSLAVVGGVMVQKAHHGKLLYSIKLTINGSVTPAEWLKERMIPLYRGMYPKSLPYGLYSTFIHELTHASEGKYLRDTQYESDISTKEKAFAYYNDPLEVRAFMQQVVDEAAMQAALLREGWEIFPPSGPVNNQAFVKDCLNKSITWGDVERHLSPTNRAKILKAVYTELDEKGLLR